MTGTTTEVGAESPQPSEARTTRSDGAEEDAAEGGSPIKPPLEADEAISSVPPETEELHPRKRKRPLDNNVYSTKKTVAQGMMDIALLTANAAQLKTLLKHRSTTSDSLFAFQMTCLCLSIILQVVVGVLLIVNSRYNINRPSHHSKADLLNNMTVIGIFLITMVNVLASTLGDYS